jgi:hypothetical protein
MVTLVTDKIPFGRVVQWTQRRASASTMAKKIGCPRRRPFGDYNDDDGDDSDDESSSSKEEVSSEEESVWPPRSNDSGITDSENDDNNDGRDDGDNDRSDYDDDSDDQCSDDTFN